MAVEEDAADKDVEGAAAGEAEEERGVAGHLGRDLELEEAGGETEEYDVAADDDGLEAEREELRDATEDHDHGDHEVDNAENV